MKAIETVYNGYRFRSRLEARWAVFFDALGVVYQYEPEGYDLNGVRYLPDFWLPQLNCWVEVKRCWPTDKEEEKAQLLAWHTGKQVYIFHGDVWLPDAGGAIATLYNPIEVFVELLPDALPRYAVFGTGLERRPRKITLSQDLSYLLIQVYQLKVSLGIRLHTDPLTLLVKPQDFFFLLVGIGTDGYEK